MITTRSLSPTRIAIAATFVLTLSHFGCAANMFGGDGASECEPTATEPCDVLEPVEADEDASTETGDDGVEVGAGEPGDSDGDPNRGGAYPSTDGVFEPMHVFYLGHSLVSDVPDFTAHMAKSVIADSFTFLEQNIPGAPLRYQWVEAAPGGSNPFVPANTFQENAHVALASGDYSHFIATDSVPRGGPEAEDETVESFSQMVAMARAARPDIRIYYYETWHHITSGTSAASPYDNVSPTRTLLWRPRLEADAPMWQRIVDRVNDLDPAGSGEHAVSLIPAGRILGRVVDAMNAGEIPGFDDTTDLFADDIHLNHYGKFIIGAIHAAVLTGCPPAAFDVDAVNRWGVPYWGVQFWDGNTYVRPSAAVTSRFLAEVEQGLAELDARP